MKINIFIHLIFVAACLSVNAQQIQNIRFEQEGKKINIYYDLLSGESGQKYDIQVYCSTDDGSTWGSPLQHISGSVGKNQKAGYDKKIIWDVLAEKEKLTGNIKFKINAVFSELSGKSGTFIDSRDGQSYKWVRIGDQIWMAENLNVGTMIYGSQGQTNDRNIEKYCYKNNNTNCDEYGGLYKWYEMMQYTETQGTQGICPNGWHIPTNDEWSTLVHFLGESNVAGGKLKETGTPHWNSPNKDATNSSGFSALPGGYRGSNGYFIGLGYYAYFWSSSEFSILTAWYRKLFYDSEEVFRRDYPESYGFSVRCLQD
ncbi:MAG: fibrobacter succinogenes major paralogous domain-containing protein [Bacteroidetes bacterium]|nr:fibrobacter succinogenes major paralogous domain-containing protein [Bacteroidota bacterium]